jgi:hypothetical protein
MLLGAAPESSIAALTAALHTHGLPITSWRVLHD